MAGKRVAGDLLRHVYQHINYRTIITSHNTADTNHAHTAGGKQYCLSHPSNNSPRENTGVGEGRGREGEAQEKRFALSCVF